MRKEILSKNEAIQNGLQPLLQTYSISDSDSLTNTSVNAIVNSITNLYRVVYVYRFTVTYKNTPSEFTYKYSEKLDDIDGAGIYKVWFEKDNRTFYFNPTESFTIPSGVITQSQDMYIYSNCRLDFPDSSSPKSYSIFYCRGEHLITYYITANGEGNVKFKGAKNSINEIGYDDDYQSESDFTNNLFNVTFDYEGDLHLYVYCYNPDEYIEVVEQNNCTLGDREFEY